MKNKINIVNTLALETNIDILIGYLLKKQKKNIYI